MAWGLCRPDSVVPFRGLNGSIVPEAAIVFGQAVWENASHEFLFTLSRFGLKTRLRRHRFENRISGADARGSQPTARLVNPAQPPR